MIDHMTFIHLHLHSQFSLLDGAIKYEGLIERCHRYHMNSVAVTDHGNLFGAIKFYQYAINNGIKPIIGCEVYITPGSIHEKHSTRDNKQKLFHLTLLAENNEGYRNLCQLVSKSFIEGFYYRPRLDRETLRHHTAGLIACSGCMNGEIATHILAGQMDLAKASLLDYRSMFPPHNFYLEVMNHNLPEEAVIVAGIKELRKEIKVGVVATNDCHYLDREDARAHDVLLAIQTGKDVKDTERLKMPNDEFYFKSPSEMQDLFSDLPEAITTTAEIANRCSVDLERRGFHIPHYECPSGSDSREFLRERVLAGKIERYGTAAQPTVDKQIEFELGVINHMKFADYFLIVWDMIKFARDNGVMVGPGRGSAAGSIVAYCLKITDLDPLEYGLLFERFLNPERISMPDIDIDFEDERREEVVKYLFRKYGEARVVKVITFQNLKARKAIKDVGRVMGVPFPEMNELTKLIPDELNITIDNAIEKVPELQKLVKSESLTGDVLRIARSLEGLPGYPSTHAAGVVIGDVPLIECVPLFRDSKREEITTQYEKDSLEQIGLLKMDILGLKNLTIIKNALRLIKERRQTTIDWPAIGLADPKTYELFSSGETLGVFQLESDGMRDLLRKLQPAVFTDIIALIALYRPGPLGSNMVDDFVQRKHGKKEIDYFHPRLEPVLRETYGIILYQEQVMQIASLLAGFSLSAADNLRKAMSKKNPAVMEKFRDQFIAGAVRNKVKAELAETIFTLMEHFAAYGFNKSHSAVYAVLAYQTAYLKAHYPVEFMTAVLNNELGNLENLAFYVKECQRLGIPVLKPDINTSVAVFMADKDSIRFGLAACKNVGTGFGEALAAARGFEPFADLEDFFTRMDFQGINKRVLESLVMTGAFDALSPNRKALFDSIEEWLNVAQKAKMPGNADQGSLFDGLSDAPALSFPALKTETDWDETIRCKHEKEILGFYLSGHPLAKYQAVIDSCHRKTLAQLLASGGQEWVTGLIEKVTVKYDRNQKPMAIMVLSDEQEEVESLVFNSVYEKCKERIVENTVVMAKLRNDKNEGSRRLLADQIVGLPAISEYVIRLGIRSPAGPGASPGLDKPLSLKLQKLMKKYPGTLPVMLKVPAEDNTHIVLRLDDRVAYSEELFASLGKLLPAAEIRWILK